MSADQTANKRRAHIDLTDNPFQTTPCPTCNKDMAIDLLVGMYLVDCGEFDGKNVNLRWAEASHTVIAADGGNEYALECNHCNRTRGATDWNPAEHVRRYVMRSKDYAPNKKASERVKGAREYLLRMGYPLV